jgi:hypothetical protein
MWIQQTPCSMEFARPAQLGSNPTFLMQMLYL